jgi:hypothetical protein
VTEPKRMRQALDLSPARDTAAGVIWAFIHDEEAGDPADLDRADELDQSAVYGMAEAVLNAVAPIILAAAMEALQIDALVLGPPELN